jgi:hypothetical protein
VRILRYLHSLWTFRRLLSRHNLRALWRQSKPGWQNDLGFADDLTEEEYDAFLKTLEDLG